jgi:dolichol-phosphate mannosyltransferase
MVGHPRSSSDSGRPLSLVIPAYNEEAAIAQAIVEADEALRRLGSVYEILVVDDGSGDRTAKIVAEAARDRPNVRLLKHAENRGYGAALRTGFEAARFAHVAFTDADCQLDLTNLDRLLPLTDRYPVVAGYRVDRQDSALRRFASWGYNLLARSLLGTRVRDCDCALKVFRKETLTDLLPESRGFFVNTEMLARARQLGYVVAEVGVRHRPRLHGHSKVSIGDVPKTLKTMLPFWWSRVLLRGSATGQSTLPWRHPAAMLALLVLVAGLLFFARPRTPLLEPEEARYAEIPRQMLEQGHFVVPVLHGQPYYHKPPLLYWLVMGSFALFGVHDWAARLVPCTASFLTVLVSYAWGRKTLGDRAAFLSAMILCLSARFIYLGRMLTMDSLLCLWVVSALASAHLALQSGRFRGGWWFLSAVACGLGILTKGPVAAVLVVLPMIVYLFLDRRGCRAGPGGWLVYTVTALLVAAPWYVLAAAHDPSFVEFFLWTHNVVRYVAPYDHPRPFWFYLPDLFLGMLPWSLLLPSLAIYLARHSRTVAPRRPPALGFFLLAALSCLAFYSASGCKRAGYILPVFPPLALALGTFLDSALPRHGFDGARCRGSRVLRQALGRLAAPATLGLLILGGGGALLAAAVGLCKPAHGLILAALSVLGVVGCVLVSRFSLPRSSEARWAICGATTFVLIMLAIHQVLPGYARKFSLRHQVHRPMEMARGDEPVICFPHVWDSVTFYLRRSDVNVYGAGERAKMLADVKTRPEALVFVKSDDQADRASAHCLTDLRRALPPELEFVPFGRPGIATAGVIRRRGLPPDMLLAEN